MRSYAGLCWRLGSAGATGFTFCGWARNAERVERAARRLATKLEVEPVKKTNLIAVSYAADDPQSAAKVLQSVEKAYLEKHMEVHRPTGEYRFFERQTGESRRQLEDSKRKLLDFMERQSAVAAAEQRDLALQKLSDVDASYRQTRVDLVETQERAWALESQLEKLPERTTTQVRRADNAELLKALKSSLLDLQLKRTGLLTKFEPSHRLVQEVEQQIAQAEAMITAEKALPLKDETTDKNAQYEWAKSELQKTQVQLKALQGRDSASRAQLGAYRAMAERLGEDAITQDDLLSSEKAAQDNYLLYVKKQEEARIDDALDEGRHCERGDCRTSGGSGITAVVCMDRACDRVGGGGRGGHGCCLYRGLSGSRLPHTGRCAGVSERASFGIPASKAIRGEDFWRSMREVGAGIMSLRAFLSRRTAGVGSRVRQRIKNLKQVEGWNPEDFAREQIQGLVLQVFFSRAERPARQVVFSAAEPETDVQNLCWRVAEALSLETSGDIALVGEYPQACARRRESRDWGTGESG